MTQSKQFFCYLVRLAIIAIIAAAISACVPPKQELSPMQKRQITTKNIDGSYDNIFRSLETTLQDQGYIIKSADMDSGLITAESAKATPEQHSHFHSSSSSSSSSESIQDRLKDFMNERQKKGTSEQTQVSATVIKNNSNTSEVRMTIQKNTYNTTGAMIDSHQDYTADTYHSLFSALQVEVKRREAMGKE